MAQYLSKKLEKFAIEIKKYNKNIAFFLTVLFVLIFETYCYYGFIGYSVLMIKSSSLIHYSSQFMYTLLCSLVVMMPYFFVKKRKGIVLISASVYTIYLIINVMYFRTYNTIMPIWAFGQTENLNGLGRSIIYSLRPADLFLFVPVILLPFSYYFYFKNRIVVNSNRSRVEGILIIALVIVLFTGFDMEKEHKMSGNYLNKIELLYFDQCKGTSYISPLGCLLWQINDFFRQGTKIKPEEEQEVINWLKGKEDSFGYPPEKVIPGQKNLIVIIVESLESWPIKSKINNREITPCLNRLINTNNAIYALKVAPQTKGGRSSDTQFMINTGLLPAKDGAVFFRFPNHKYYSIAQALKNRAKYTTALFIGQDPSYWNQAAMNHSMGFEKFYSSLNFNMSDIECMGLSDESFFKQSVNYIKEIKQPFFIQLITLSSHTPFKLSARRVKIDLPSELPSPLSDYIKCVNYTDSCIGDFVSKLKGCGLFDKSIIVVIGDHEALPKDQRAMLTKDKLGSKYITGDEYVPLIIINSPYNFEYKQVMGQIDVYPTILDLFGLSDYKWAGLGRSIFCKDKETFVVNAKLDVIGDRSSTSAAKIKKAQKEWDISNIIIVKDLFAKLNSF